MSRFARTLTSTGSGNLPLPYMLGLLTSRGRLKSKGISGGVDACFAIVKDGDGERGDPPGDGDLGKSVLAGLDGESGVDPGGGGASDPLLDLDLTLSRSTLRNGSGSNGSIIFSSLRVGVTGLSISIVSLKVTVGTLFLRRGVRGIMWSAIARSWMLGVLFASSICTSSSLAVCNRSLATFSTCRRTSGVHLSHSWFNVSPLIIKHSTADTERTVAVRRGASERLTTSPKYCPGFNRAFTS